MTQPIVEPAWVSSAEPPVKGWYEWAFSMGLDEEALRRAATADPRLGVAPKGSVFSSLPLAAQRGVVANLYAQALIASEGIASKYEDKAVVLQAAQNKMGWGTPAEHPPVGDTGTDKQGMPVQVWAADIKKAFLRLSDPNAQFPSVAVTGSSPSLLFPALLVLLIAFVVWRKSRG